MKIIIACDGITLGRGGAERVAVWLANGFSRSGHQVRLFTRDPSRQSPVYPLDPGVLCEFYTLDEGETVIPDLRRRIVELQPDACIVFCWHNMLLPWVIAVDGTGAALIASEHASPDFIERPAWSRDERLTSLAGSDAIHLLSKKYLASLPEEYRERATVIANPVLREAFSGLPGDKKHRVLLSVGGLNLNKQHHLLINAFALAHKRIPQWRLDIWGEGEERDALQRLIDDLGLAEAVCLCGVTDRIFEEYREAEFFCMPSRLEGFPMALAEALAHGLPAVGFAGCTGVNELILSEKNGLLAPDMTAESLAESLAALMADDTLRRELGAAAPVSVRPYAEDLVLEKWLDLIAKTVLWKREGGKPSVCMPYSHLLKLHQTACTTKTFLAMHHELKHIYASQAWKLIKFLRKVKLFLHL